RRPGRTRPCWCLPAYRRRECEAASRCTSPSGFADYTRSRRVRAANAAARHRPRSSASCSTATRRLRSVPLRWDQLNTFRAMRILVVEDHGELVDLLAKALARAGLDVDAARNAADAEASLRGVHYAAVVLDLGLPDADGLTVLDAMRRRRDETP